MKIIIYGENKIREEKWKQFLSSRYPEVEIFYFSDRDSVLDAIANHDVIMVIVNIESNPDLIIDLKDIKKLIQAQSINCEVVVVANPTNSQLVAQLSGIASINVGRREEDRRKVSGLVDKIISKRSGGDFNSIPVVDFATRIATLEQMVRERENVIRHLKNDIKNLTHTIYGGIGIQGIDDRIARIEEKMEHLEGSWTKFKSSIDEELSNRIWHFILYPAVEFVKNNPTPVFAAITAVGAIAAFVVELVK